MKIYNHNSDSRKNRIFFPRIISGLLSEICGFFSGTLFIERQKERESGRRQGEENILQVSNASSDCAGRSLLNVENISLFTSQSDVNFFPLSIQ